MKKFLTVLLVIAVMFTFSFSSAFAADIKYVGATAEQKTAIDKAIDYMYNQFETKVYDKATADGITVATDSVKISAESFAAVKAEALTEVKEVIKACAKDYAFDDATKLQDMDTAVLANAIFKNEEYYSVDAFKDYLDDKYDEGTTDGRTFELSAAQEEVKATYEDAVEMLGLVNYDAYSTTSPSEANSYQKRAKAAVEAKLTDLYNKYVAIEGANAPAALTTMAKCKTAIEAIDELDELGLKDEEYGTTGIKTGYYLVDDASIKTIAAEEVSAPTDAANEAVVKANVAAIVATFTKDHGTVTGAAAAAKAYTEMYNYLAEYYVGKTLPKLDYTSDEIQIASDADNTTLVKTAYKNVTDLEALAAKLKAEKDANGNLVRDAKEIDKILAAAISDIYTVAGYSVDTIPTVTKNTTEADGVTPASYVYGTAAVALTNCTVNKDAAEFEFVKAAKKAELQADLEEAIDEDLGDYYALEAEKVKVAYETAIAAVEAAAAPKDITAAEVALDKALKVIKNADQVDALFVGTAIETYIDDQVTNIEMLVGYKNAAAGALSHQDAFIADDTAKAKLVEYYIDNNARTLAEVKALAEEAASAVVAKLPTNADIAAAKKAAEDAIKALPAASKITVADKDAVAEVLDLMDAYEDLGGTASGLTGYGTVEAKVDAVIADLQREATKAFALADKTDKDALDAILDQIDESNDFIARQLDEEEEISVPAIEAALEKIRTAEKKAAQKAIDELPINVTAADKAKVEAARALYDAYVAKWQDVKSGDYAANDINTRDLDLAEAVLGLNQPDPEENAKAYVQDLSIKARSTKTAKGVKVTIKADVQELLDAGFTVEYKFYRSTKSNKGFKAMVTKTTGTYTNTKGVKGTKYFYKVKLVVKNAAGEVVATTPLTQCLYASRTF